MQRPADDPESVTGILNHFPVAMDQLLEIISQITASPAWKPRRISAAELIRTAYARNCLTGDLATWLEFAAWYDNFESFDLSRIATVRLATTVRQNSWIFWQTYDNLSQRFRWQTQLRPITVSRCAPPRSHSTLQSA